MRQLSSFTLPMWKRQGLTNDLFRDFDQFFEGFTPAVKAETNYSPDCEVTETDESFKLSFDLPGLKKEEIQISLDKDQLVVSGERRREIQTDKSEKVQRIERSYGSFKRIFALPSQVSADTVEAEYRNGVLNIVMPKDKVEKTRKIEIKVGESEKAS